MNPSTPPDELQQLLAGYVLNNLSDEEAAMVEQLLQDPEVNQSVEQMQAALEAAYAPPEVQPPPHLRQRVMQAFESQVLPVVVSATPPPVVLLPRWIKALGAAAAALIVALSVSNYLLWRSLQSQQAQLNQAPLVLSLQPTETLNVPASVMVQLDPDTLQGTLIIENLPPLAPDKVYVLWTVLAPNAPFTTDAKNAILTQVFTVEEPGSQTQPLILPRAFQNLDLIAAIAISIEDAETPQNHESAPILFQPL